MSIKKHRPTDEEVEGPLAKKVRIADADANGDERKRAKKERKEEKKAQRKRDKKERRQRAAIEAQALKEEEEKEEPEDKEEEEPSGEDVEKKAKKEKKEKKEKKAKKEKKHKDKTEDAGTPQDSSAEATDDSIDGPAPATGTYQQSDALATVSDDVVQAFLKKEQVAVYDPRAPKAPAAVAAGLRPILEFAHLPRTPLTKKSPFAAYKVPTPIQAASWPYTLGGRDLVGIAETGSGKTMAFALPLVEALRGLPKPARVEAKQLPARSRLNNKWEAKGHVAQALAVIVSPTRELAMQTHAAIQPLAALVGLTSVCLYGGASKDEQRVLLRQPGGVDIIVATPGRLKDFMSEEAVSLAHVRFAVLDEADRMLDTGFEDDIRLILGACPERGTQRQTLMFTATWPTSVRGLADGFMVDPVKITVGSRTRAGALDEDGEARTDSNGAPLHDGGRSNTGAVELQANARITQTVEVLDPREKERRLLAVLRQEQRGKARDDRILVFCLYKKEAVRVENFLQGQGIRVCSIHGDLRQEQRTRSLEAFKSGSTPVLVATDVAARGLDIPEVKLVINVTVSLSSHPAVQPPSISNSAVPFDHRGLCPPDRPDGPCRQGGPGPDLFH